MNRLFNMTFAALLAGMVAVFSALAQPAAAAELLMFKEDACPWCMKFEREVGRIYDNTPESKIAPLKRIDIDDIPEEYAHVMPVIYTPTFILLDDEKHVIGRIEGYPGFDFFWLRLGELLDKLKKHETQKAAHRDTAPRGRATPRG